MIKQRLLAHLPLIGATALLLILTMQYPFSTTFPIGGDAAFYVRTARTLLEPTEINEKFSILKSAPYPLAYLGAASSVLLPLEWPERFTWLMTITYMAVGGALGFFLYRYQGRAAAATAVALWSLVSVDVTTHIEAGTLAQLLSLVFVALFFERLVKGSWWGVPLAYVAVLLSHPLTGLLLLLAVVLMVGTGVPLIRSFPSPERRVYLLLAALATLSGGAVAIKIGLNQALFTTGLQSSTLTFPLPNLLRSTLGPWLMMAPLGFIRLTTDQRISSVAKMTLVTFILSTLVLSFNYLFGIGLWTERFQSYFVFGTIILASIAFPWLMNRVFMHWLPRSVFVVLLFLALALTAWNSNARIFRYYEAPGNYARLQTGEHEGIRWMNDNLPTDSVVVTSNVHRHAEWIPALTNRQWLAVPHFEDEAIINNKLQEARVFGRPVYLVLFLTAEKRPAIFPTAEVMFETAELLILKIR